MNCKRLMKLNKKIVFLDEIQHILGISDYSNLVKTIDELEKDNRVVPVKNSGRNGKTPSLYKKYRIITYLEDKTELMDEINYKLSPKLNIEYYKKNLKKYEEDRVWILKLNNFLINNYDKLNAVLSMNERSFQIWGREKFLQKEGGKNIIKKLGLNLTDLNYYDTSEPLAYYSRTKEVPQNVLIIENKDTYYTLRKHLIQGSTSIFGTEIGTIIYGSGKNIVKTFQDFKISVEDYVSSNANTILYFGDLDYEGIAIYESFEKRYKTQYTISVCKKAYEAMIDKVDNLYINLPDSHQLPNIKSTFIDEFNIEYKQKINEILQNGKYIPQEIINTTDLAKLLIY